MDKMECVFTLTKVIRNQVNASRLESIMDDLVFLETSPINKDNVHKYLTDKGLRKIRSTINQNYRVVIR